MSIELTIIIAIFGLIGTLTGIASFFIGRKEKGKEDGVKQGQLSNDIEYIKQTQTNILIGQKEMTAKLDKTHDEVIVLKVKTETIEEKEKELEDRVLKLEKKKGE